MEHWKYPAVNGNYNVVLRPTMSVLNTAEPGPRKKMLSKTWPRRVKPRVVLRRRKNKWEKPERRRWHDIEIKETQSYRA
jgi:hypothetical protein